MQETQDKRKTLKVLHIIVNHQPRPGNEHGQCDSYIAFNWSCITKRYRKLIKHLILCSMATWL